MKKLFLLCALALPPAPKDKEFKMMKAFFKKHYPHTEVVLVHRDEVAVGLEYLATPLRFKGMQIWLKKSA